MSIRIPLARSAPPLPDPLISRHERTIQVAGVGLDGQRRLASASVLVIGAGGLGSPVLSYLAASGIGHLGICEFDTVNATNLQRQILYLEADLGHPKVERAAQHLRNLNSSVTVKTYPRADHTLLDSFRDDYDVVVECTDTFDSKYLVADWCAEAGKPLVWGTVTGVRFQVSDFWSTPPKDSGLPSTSLRQLFGPPPKAGAVPSAEEVGVLGPAVGVCGSVMATEVIKLVTGFGEPLIGRVLMADLGCHRWEVLPFCGRD